MLLKFTQTTFTRLLHKDGPNFWKVWRSKFNTPSKCDQVDGCADNSTIARKFMEHLASAPVLTRHTPKLWRAIFLELRRNYVGTALTDVELIAGVISQLKRGKAAGRDNIVAGHLQYSHHSILPCLLTKLFNWLFELVTFLVRLVIIILYPFLSPRIVTINHLPLTTIEAQQ